MPAREQSHDERPGRLPSRLPYHVEALSAASALVYIWTLPAFQQALGGKVEADPDVPVLLLVRHLGMFGASTPSALARDLGMTRSNMSKIAARAEARSLITRQVDDRDGRSIRVSLTESGHLLADRGMAVGDEMMQRLTRTWTPDEVTAWTALTQRLAESAARYAERIITLDGGADDSRS